MKKETLLALGAALIAMGQELGASADDTNGGTDPGEGGGENKPKRGRPAKEPPGKTLDDMKELVRPLLEEGRTEEVKKAVAKYSKTGIKDIPPESFAAFEKDIAALSI